MVRGRTKEEEEEEDDGDDDLYELLFVLMRIKSFVHSVWLIGSLVVR
jgi:hypothetical protein